MMVGDADSKKCSEDLWTQSQVDVPVYELHSCSTTNSRSVTFCVHVLKVFKSPVVAPCLHPSSQNGQMFHYCLAPVSFSGLLMVDLSLSFQ